LRWIDVKPLKWGAIDLKEKNFSIIQSKTEIEVKNPLNDTAIKLLGEPGKPANRVFELPTANGANKTLKAWVKRAKIDKEITWHNARHSFGTNLILNEVEVLTASKLLGHTSLKHTYRYVDTAKDLKAKATNKLNFEIN
jgi:integrase/recombinase XerD